jgi:capsid protein
MHAVMLEVKQYAAFKEAVLFASRFGASTYATIERDPSSTADYANGRDKNGQLYRNIDKGQIVMLNPGEKLNSYTPPFPNNAIDPMLKSYERSIATGVGASFATLTSDYSESNFSSSRLGVNEERQDWKTKQQWYISTFLEPLFSDWLETCLINGTLVYKGKKLTLNDFPRLNNIQFKGIKLPLIDPLKDINTIAKEISIGTKSIPQAIEELHGTDVDTVFRHHKYAFDLANQLGIPIELYMKYALNQSVIEKNESQAEAPQEASQDIKQEQANRSLAADIESQMVALAKAMKQETVPVTITNVIRSPGYKTVKTPILDEDGLIVKVIEEDVPCDTDTETNIEDNKEQL